MFIGAHRGFGCTDHDFYQPLRNIAGTPVENTYESVEKAFAHGAGYVEIDAVMSADDVLFILHNVVPKDHFFTPEIPAGLLNQMNFADIIRYKTGRLANGVIARLDDILKLVAEKAPASSPFAINIEIKGVQGSNQNFETNDYLKRLADAVKQSPLAESRVLFSSFSLQNIIAMSHLLPQAQYGMLFAERTEGRPIYADHQDDFRYRYLVFNAAEFKKMQDIWQAEADRAAKLSFVHPEIVTVTPDMMRVTGEAKMGMNAWALFEELTDARKALYRQVKAEATQQNVPFTVITDYIDELIAILT